MLKCERCSVLLLMHPVLGNSLAEERAQVVLLSPLISIEILVTASLLTLCFMFGEFSFWSKIFFFSSVACILESLKKEREIIFVRKDH